MYLWTQTPSDLEIAKSFPEQFATLDRVVRSLPYPDANVTLNYPTPKSMTSQDKLSMLEYLTTRANQLVDQVYDMAVKTIECGPQDIVKAPRKFTDDDSAWMYEAISQSPVRYRSGVDLSLADNTLYAPFVRQVADAFQHLAPIGLEYATVYFIPEMFLAFALMRLILRATTELARDLPHKVIANNAWRAACEGLALVAFLYALQLFGCVPVGTAFYGYLYVSKSLTMAKLFVTLTSLFVLHSSGMYIREHSRHILEYPMVILIAVLLLLLLVSTNNLLMLFLVFAGFSLNLYILVVFDVPDAASREASLKYFYLSTLSTGFMLFGTLLLYVIFGDVSYNAIAMFTDTIAAVDPRATSIISAGVVAIVIGFLFKLSAFPGHLWAVEVYEGSPMPVMAFFVLPAKVAVFITFLRLLNTAFYSLSSIWLPVIAVAALGSLVWGAFAAIQSRRTVRFLGYASINQMGFLLLGLATNTDLGLRAALFYLLIYALMTGGFLLALLHLRKPNGTYFTALADFRGMWQTESLLCWNLTSSLFSMAGIPPLAGFFGKYYLLSAALDRGMFTQLIAALILSVISTNYYLRIIRVMWFEGAAAVKKPVVLLSVQQRMALSAASGILWVAAPFLSYVVVACDDVIYALTVCGDATSCLVDLAPSLHSPSRLVLLPLSG